MTTVALLWTDILHC